jgi:two-component system cell cycle response regulator DivK
MTAAKTMGPPIGSQAARDATVLVIEDNDLNLRLFHDLLAANGYRVLKAQDGETGFRLAREEQPHVILLDIQLPGASGLEVTQWIKSDPATREIPVVAVTALAMRGDEQRVLAAGCDAYVAKPIACADLLEVVAGFLQ